MKTFLKTIAWLTFAITSPLPAPTQIPAPQINLGGNIGCQGFPCLNNGILILTADANHTMTPLETSAFYIKVISSVSLTATRNLIYPAGRFPVAIENATTGGQSLNVCGPSGSCVTVPNDATSFTLVWNDGTNFVSAGGGSSGVTSINSTAGAFTFTGSGVSCSSTTCTFSGSSGGVTSFAAPSGSWPSWLVPTVTDSTTTPSLAVAASAIPNSALQNASTTVNSQTCTLGASCTVTAAPSGSAGGDLSGSYPDPVVAQVNGAAIPTSANLIGTNSSGQLTSATSANISAVLGYAPAQQVSFTGDLATGVLADYNFSQGTGTTLTDISGNGNNGTLGASGGAEPAWVQNGLYFSSGSDYVSLPSTLNSAETFVMAFYFNPISTTPGGTNYNSAGQYSPLISSSLGSTGINFIMNNPTTSSSSPLYSGMANWSIWNGSGITVPYFYGAGFHVLQYTLGTGSGNVDHIYFDGVESPYILQGSTAGAQTSGNLYIGSAPTSPWAGLGGTFTMYRMRVYSGQLSSTDASQIAQLFRQYASQLGVYASPPVNPIGIPILHCIGDSITEGQGVSTPFCSELSLNSNQPTYTIYNWGIGGITLQAITTSDVWRVAPYCASTASGPPIANVFAGTNDFNANHNTTSATAALQVMAFLRTEISILKRAGCRVFVSTMLSRTGASGGGARTYDADKDVYNALIRNLALSYGADGITDMAVNPDLGADGASTNTTYFQSDGTHPTATGQAILASEMSNALNYYFGYSKSNPNVQTATYSMTASDGGLEANCSSACTITLPDCTGQTGAVYSVSNPQSTNTVTLKTLNSSQTLDGVDYSSTGLTLTGNSTLAVRDIALPSSTAGCVWSHTAP